VSATLEQYRRDFEKGAARESGKYLFARFWKLFFNDLITEADKICDRQGRKVKNAEQLREDLHHIIETGVSEFYWLTTIWNHAERRIA
jgi:hypothetical protein